MKINHKILSIPPYISTSWKNIQTLFLRGPSLIITLGSGTEIAIPELPTPILREIFEAHTSFLEKDKAPESAPPLTAISSFSFGLPLPSIDQLTKTMHHNPEQAHAGDLPKEILQKVTEVIQTIGLDEGTLEALPPAEPHCNCPYCQISKAIHEKQGILQEELLEEKSEFVADDELNFREWLITQVDAQRFILKNPLNPTEQYQVYLGTPVGCTCGNPNCEHVHFVLRN